MAGQTTKPYRNTLSGSIGAGMGSLFNPSGRKYYILEHKVSSKYHRAGESQEIIVDNIELGRDSHCQVRFDESFKTVSRHHAAIVRDGENWKLIQISHTNTPLLNGRTVQTEWYLQNGDEIQLSINGPKLGFIIPTGKKATVGSIGLTRRLSLFRQQALRPYKQAIAGLAALLIVAALGGGYVIYQQGEQLKDNSKQLAEAKEANAKNEKLIAEQKKLLSNQEGVLDSLKKLKPKVVTKVIERPSPTPKPNGIDMSSCYPYIYHITAIPLIDGEPIQIDDEGHIMASVGTGFQLAEGKFVTARHVTSPYYTGNSYYIADGKIVPVGGDIIQTYFCLMLNILAQQGKVSYQFKCVSSGGSFEFTSSSIKENEGGDQTVTLKEAFRVVNPNTEEVIAEIPAGTVIRRGGSGVYDYSYINRKGEGLKANREISSQLKQGTKLHVLGYPHGWNKGEAPIYSEAICSKDGLSKDLGGTIMASNDNTEGGNSGGPIFIQSSDGWEVVAIVSGGNRAKGRFVPISVVP